MSTTFTITSKAYSTTQTEIFRERLIEVEQRHIDWFKNRPAIFDHQLHDGIQYHIFSEIKGESFSFNFWKHSELPQKIKDECVQAFNDVFGTVAMAG